MNLFSSWDEIVSFYYWTDAKLGAVLLIADNVEAEPEWETVVETDEDTAEEVTVDKGYFCYVFSICFYKLFFNFLLDFGLLVVYFFYCYLKFGIVE